MPSTWGVLSETKDVHYPPIEWTDLGKEGKQETQRVRHRQTEQAREAAAKREKEKESKCTNTRQKHALSYGGYHNFNMEDARKWKARGNRNHTHRIPSISILWTGSTTRILVIRSMAPDDRCEGMRYDPSVHRHGGKQVLFVIITGHERTHATDNHAEEPPDVLGTQSVGTRNL